MLDLINKEKSKIRELDQQIAKLAAEKSSMALSLEQLYLDSLNKTPELKMGTRLENRIKIGISSTHGHGCFAVCDIAKHSTFTDNCTIIETTQLKTTNLWKYAYPWSNGYSSICQSFGSFFNHNAIPNVKISAIDKINNTKTFIALRNIREGEELFINYGNSKFN